MALEFKGIAIVTGHTCGPACWHAKDDVCRCSCGGKNHGVFARGGDQPTRTARISGNVYELVEIGTYRQIEARRMDEIKAMNHHWYYDPKGPWLSKCASVSQLNNWPELAPFLTEDVASGRVGVYLLWKLQGVKPLCTNAEAAPEADEQENILAN